MTSSHQPADQNLLQKVRKLLAMAEGSPNPNEADAFSRKAAELIAAYRIDPERLVDESTSGLGVWEVEVGRGAYVRGRLSLLHAVVLSLGCQIVFDHRDRGTVAMVAGFRDDLDTAELLYNSLHTQACSRMASERRATAAATQQWRRSFLFGYANQIHEMLTATATDARDQMHPSQATLPALRARDRQVDEFARHEFGRVVTARRPKPATPNGWRAGQRAASRADLGRKRVVGLRAIGRGA